LRKARFIAVALLALFGITAVAFAQTNAYTVSGTVAKGGSKAKPKTVGLKLNYTVGDASGLLPAPVKKYSIGFEGMKADTSFLPKCSAASMTQAKTNSGCPAKSLVGSGNINALVGAKGSPAATAAKCQLGLSIHNSGGGKAALWLEGGPGSKNDCLATIAQAIDAKFVQKGTTTSLEFTVPPSLLHQLGLDVPVISVTSTIKKIAGKTKSGKATGFFRSVGCKDKKRDITVTFTDETGKATPVKKTIGAC
jgi:hypothetical protein